MTMKFTLIQSERLSYAAALALITLCLFFIASISSCNKECLPLKGKGVMIEKNYLLGTFNKIELSLDAAIELTQGTQQAIRIKGQENILEILELEIQNNTLHIGFTKNCGSLSYQTLQIQITIPELKGIDINGNGTIKTMNNIDSDALEFNISGSGSIQAGFVTNSLTGKISGSGNMFLSGDCTSSKIAISGSGNYFGINLQTQDVVMHISGSGDAEIWVENSLNVMISGSGNVRYKGNASVSSSISGSGTVNHVQ